MTDILFRKPLFQFGSLRDHEIIEIQSRYSACCRLNGGAALAREFGVSPKEINKVVGGRRSAAPSAKQISEL